MLKHPHGRALLGSDICPGYGKLSYVARGWESKSVEEQIEGAADRQQRVTPPLTEEEQQRRRARESLELSRARVMKDLESAKHPRRREMLEAALKHLEEKIAAL